MPPPAYISDIYIQYIYKEITESLEAAVDDEAARELNLTHGVTSLKYVGFKFIYRVHRSEIFFAMKAGSIPMWHPQATRCNRPY